MGEKSLLRLDTGQFTIDSLFHQMNDIKDQTHEVQKRLKDLDDRIYRLERSVPQIRKERSKYINCFKRDKLHKALTSGEGFDVEDENVKMANDGNIIFDADLYEGPTARRDRIVFKHLYGIDPAAVKDIGEYKLTH